MTGADLARRDAKRHVVVVGGGLAGLASAIACIDGGARVTLLEARPRFGGATWSFERKGHTFDNGQHVYLRCCDSYQQFLERIGSAHLAPIQGPLDIPVVAPALYAGGAPVISHLRRGVLPAPGHLAKSILGYSHLAFRDRLNLGKAALALRKLDLTDPNLDAETFGSFLARHGQSKVAIEAFWDLIGLPTTNLRAKDVSLLLAAKVFQTLLGDAKAGDIGWSSVPLQRLHSEPALQLLERSGASILGRSKAIAIETVNEPSVPGASAPRSSDSFALLRNGQSGNAGRAVAVVTESERIEADAVVLAVAHEDAARLLPVGSGIDAKKLSGLGFSPIIDIHIVYDQVVMDYQVAAGVRSRVQYVFDRSGACGLSAGEGQCLAISVSGADDEHGERPEVLITNYTQALGELFPRARHAKVVDAVVTREHEATFRGVPGTASLRPGTATAYANLFVAGSWTNTGWPATMEGAVRSGIAAAAGALFAVGHERSAEQIGEGVLT